MCTLYIILNILCILNILYILYHIILNILYILYHILNILYMLYHIILYHIIIQYLKLYYVILYYIICVDSHNISLYPHWCLDPQDICGVLRLLSGLGFLGHRPFVCLELFIMAAEPWNDRLQPSRIIEVVQLSEIWGLAKSHELNVKEPTNGYRILQNLIEILVVKSRVL